jgi:ubiquinone/menaquinone biosynthesis C-methylase UbiE
VIQISTNRKTHWETIFGEKEPTKMSWYQPHLKHSLDLISRTGVGPHAAIIDVGGGDSSLVDDLLLKGFTDISVLDISRKALERARKRLGMRADAVRWIEVDVTRADLSPSYYTLWHDRAVFHFLVDAEDRRAYKDLLFRAVQPNGYVLVGTFAHDGPKECSGLATMRFSPEELVQEFSDGYELIEAEHERHQTPWGKSQSFLYCLFRKQEHVQLA